ncbi:MAG: HAD family hydrolase, partial [Acutalibacteraceae bacterium]
GENFDYEKVKAKRISLMEDYVDKNGFKVKKGAKALLAFLKEQKIITSVASTSPLDRVEKYLKKADLYKFFDFFTTGEMVKKSKPQPDIYLLASKKMGLSPKETVAFEDSPNGIISAKKASCHTVMIPDLSLPEKDILPYIDAHFKSLDEAIPYIKNIIS